MHIDASAALAITQRQSLGKLKHIAAHCSWTQDNAKANEISTLEIHGKNNLADLMAKHLLVEEINGHLERLNFEIAEG